MLDMLLHHHLGPHALLIHDAVKPGLIAAYGLHYIRLRLSQIIPADTCSYWWLSFERSGTVSASRIMAETASQGNRARQ